MVVDGIVVDAVVVEIGSVEGETDVVVVVGAVVTVDDVDAGCVGITAVVLVG